MTLQELAARLGLKTADSLRRQIARGKLSAEKVGTGRHGVWLVTEDEATRYAQENHGRLGFASPEHPMHGKQGPGHRRKEAEQRLFFAPVRTSTSTDAEGGNDPERPEEPDEDAR